MHIIWFLLLCLDLVLLALSSNTCFEGGVKYKIIQGHEHSNMAKDYSFNHSQYKLNYTFPSAASFYPLVFLSTIILQMGSLL